MTTVFHHVELRFISLLSEKENRKRKNKQIICVVAFCEGLGTVGEVIQHDTYKHFNTVFTNPLYDDGKESEAGSPCLVQNES